MHMTKQNQLHIWCRASTSFRSWHSLAGAGQSSATSSQKDDDGKPQPHADYDIQAIIGLAVPVEPALPNHLSDPGLHSKIRVQLPK